MSVRSGGASDHVERLRWMTAGQDLAGPRSRGRRVGLRASILDRYLLNEMAAPAAFAAAAFTLFLLINSFFLAADYVINKGVPFTLVARYIVLQLPAFMSLVIPFCALFGVLLGVGRIAGDNELTALRTSGISLHRIAAPYFAAGLALTVLAFVINDSIAPIALTKSQELFRQIAYHSSQPIIEPYRFIRTEDGKHVIYVEATDPDGTMHGVEIYTIANGVFPQSLTSKIGHQVNGQIVLRDGVQSEYNADGLVTRQQHFQTLTFPLGDSAQLYSSSQSPWEMNSHDLAKQIQAMRMAGEDPRDAEMILQRKYAFPVAALIGVFVALPLAIAFGKRGRGVAAMLAIVVLFAYYLLMAATNALGKNGALSPTLAAWIPNILVGGAGLMLLLREER